MESGLQNSIPYVDNTKLRSIDFDSNPNPVPDYLRPRPDSMYQIGNCYIIDDKSIENAYPVLYTREFEIPHYEALGFRGQSIIITWSQYQLY
jgi:hypothetical protein